MSFPPPTERQARILWLSLTALAVGVLVALAGLLCWGFGWVVNKLSSVLLPLAVAAVVAYLLDPVVDFFERRKIPRTRAILLVFFLAVMLVLTLLATVVPQLIYETSQLVDQVPGYATELRDRLGGWLERSPWGAKAKQVWDEQLGESARQWLVTALPVVSSWLMTQLTKVASWAGLLFGFALVPIYAFYFLQEKKGIEGSWTEYLPLQESKVKEEVVFVLKEINNCLIVFFRGQVLVALCVGALLTIGFLLIGFWPLPGNAGLQTSPACFR